MSKKKNLAQQKKRVLILYFSASGATHKVASSYEKSFVARGHQVDLVNVSRSEALFKKKSPQDVVDSLPSHDILLVGSPIYMDALYEPFTELLYLLSWDHTTAGVFTTFGKLSAGVGLCQASSILSRKGRCVVSALEVDSIHSASRALEKPISARLPDASLEPLIEASVERLLAAASGKKTADVTLLLSHQLSLRLSKSRPDQRKALDKLPLVTFDPSRCTACQACLQACPVLDLSILDRTVSHQEPSLCMGCTNCLVVCPADAVDVGLDKRSAFLKKRLDEEKLDPDGPSLSQLYLA